MDDVLAGTLKRQLEKATTRAQTLDAMTNAMIALVDCQHKTADRVKDLVKKNEDEKSKKEGAKWAFSLMCVVLSAVGSTGAIFIAKLISRFFA